MVGLIEFKKMNIKKSVIILQLVAFTTVCGFWISNTISTIFEIIKMPEGFDQNFAILIILSITVFFMKYCFDSLKELIKEIIEEKIL
jgi:hypothetical protein